MAMKEIATVSKAQAEQLLAALFTAKNALEVMTLLAKEKPKFLPYTNLTINEAIDLLNSLFKLGE
jgi:hypothetical protein